MAVYNRSMSPRPRQNSDLEILQAAFRAIARVGPTQLTLADVAREADVSAASLVQRFGSKRALLLATAADAAGGHTFIFEGLRNKYLSPKRAILGLADCMVILGKTPREVAHTLAFLQAELNDPAFRQHSLRRSRGMHKGLVGLVKQAMAAGELRAGNANLLARVLQATLNGSVLEWAVNREETMASWVRRDLQAVLEPYSQRRHERATTSTATQQRSRETTRSRRPRAHQTHRQ
jgi:AcrR family transcriptional regulator